MTKLYKLTDKNGRTYNQTQWGENVTHTGTGQGGLCSEGYIHAYEHPLIAIIMNPIHANLKRPRLWEAEGEIAIREGQLKCGCIKLTTIREIRLPEITTEMLVKFAVYVALEVYRESSFVNWSEQWISGKDRSIKAAARAAIAAEAAAGGRAAARAAIAAEAAARAAWSAAIAAEAAAAEAAAEAAEAAWSAARAAWSARAADKEINMFAIAEFVMAEK